MEEPKAVQKNNFINRKYEIINDNYSYLEDINDIDTRRYIELEKNYYKSGKTHSFESNHSSDR